MVELQKRSLTIGSGLFLLLENATLLLLFLLYKKFNVNLLVFLCLFYFYHLQVWSGPATGLFSLEYCSWLYIYWDFLIYLQPNDYPKICLPSEEETRNRVSSFFILYSSYFFWKLTTVLFLCQQIVTLTKKRNSLTQVTQNATELTYPVSN